MKIQDLFVRDIFRPINGVVKADQLDESSIWQELDEFVVTKELDQHIRKFFDWYLESLEGKPNPAGKMGVWVSGFFGSGKSHFIKVLSYLLKNDSHSHNGETKQAVEFFKSKIKDPMMFADIKRAVVADTDVILFNIDSKADTKAGREAILSVFLKVLNEMQGYCPDHPHIAHMERYLESKGKLDAFKSAFNKASGSTWEKERDAYLYHNDEVVQAWCTATGQSKEAADKWIEGAEGNFSLTVENFCKWVKEYLDSKGPKHRVIFLVDEVGQFIGNDSHLMLNLQTITEGLGTTCERKAWVVVTSQEDMEGVLGELNKSNRNDFSKIQGRFYPPLSLSSANVDEVIQDRLLAKDEAVVGELEEQFKKKGDILKHQLTFTNCGMTLKNFKDSGDFIKNYPFAPYQFQLVQKIFEAIRKAGATGLHLSRGERSILDAFQSAGKQVATCEVGVLVPLYRFYPSIESFLDTAVKKTIDQASSNPSLVLPFDGHVLETLFLIRYVDEIKGNVDNLVTLFLDQIDADRLALRRKIEDSLLRLEKETLINRNGDIYSFLTNEERDVSREIKHVDLGSQEEAELLGEIIFNDVLKGQVKHRFAANKMDFAFNRLCDLYPVGRKTEGALVVSVISPLADEYSMHKDDKCVLESSQDGGQILVRLDDNDTLGREIRVYKQTEKYLKTKDDGTLPPTTKRIHRDLAEENRQRRDRLTNLLKDMLTEASYFVAGGRFEPKASVPMAALDEALEYLITNTFTKMSYLKKLNENPQREIQAILRTNDIAQQSLALTIEEGNPQAIEEVRNYLDLCTKANRPIVLHDMIERFAVRPYGWPADEVLILIARLFVTQEIQLITGGAAIPQDKVYENISTSAKWRRITVIKRKTTDPRSLQAARNLGKQLFSVMGPDGEDALCSFLQAKLRGWDSDLKEYKALAETGRYPGRDEINDGLTLTKALLALDDSFKFIERFNERKDELADCADNYHDLSHFYEHQKPTWEKLRSACERFQLNQLELERDDKAGAALKRMREILAAPGPYGLIKDAESLIATVDSVNKELVSTRRSEVLAVLDRLTEQVKSELAAAVGDNLLKTACLSPLELLRKQIESQESVAHITQAEQEAHRALDAALTKIEKYALESKPTPKDVKKGDLEPEKPVVKPRRVIEPSRLVKATYLETRDEVDGFLDSLRTQMHDAIEKGERIQIK